MDHNFKVVARSGTFVNRDETNAVAFGIQNSLRKVLTRE